jgi:hypothetical protein
MFKFIIKVLATRVMEERKTADNIRAVVLQILEEFDASRSDNVYVTDNGANIKAAFADQVWVSCTGHNINLIVSHALQGKHVEGMTQDQTAVNELVQAAKDVVTRVKRTQMQHELETTLKQAVATRWNSTLLLLKSVSVNVDRLKTLAHASNDRSLQRTLLDIDITLLNDVITVLQPFDEATRLTSADKVPTIHLVTATRLRLLDKVSENPEDSRPIKELKIQLRALINSHFRIHSIHNIALLLDPRQKNNRNLMSAEERASSIAEIKRMVSEVQTMTVAGETSTRAGYFIIYHISVAPCQQCTLYRCSKLLNKLTNQ